MEPQRQIGRHDSQFGLRRRLGLLALAATFLIAGCGDRPASSLDPQKPSITIAAASDLKFALEEIVQEFQKIHTNLNVQISYGSSGNFHAQLTQRAPFDIFLSADFFYPRRLIEAGLAAGGSEFVYAIGHIVVWVAPNSSIDPAQLKMEALRSSEIRRIAIANPEHAPYGRAAVAALEKLGLWDVVKDRLVLGENVAQAAQFVASGSADAGIIALSLARSPALAAGRFCEVPVEAYPPIEQGGLVLPWARHPEAAAQFRAFLLSEAGQSVLRRLGFSYPVE
jgi:molybdate transport system substrate-binding protein